MSGRPAGAAEGGSVVQPGVRGFAADAASVQRQRDVAVAAAARLAAGAAVQRGRDAAAVEEQDRLAAPVGEPAELGEQRRRERVAGLAAEVEYAHGRHGRPEPSAELEALERVPGLGPRRRRAEDGDGSLERCALRGDGPRVVARVGLLLVGGVVLLVDADHAERRHGREYRRAGADDDGGLAGGDPLPLVAPFRVGEGRVEDGDPVAEALAEPAERLWRQRDLGDEDDRAPAADERGVAGADVDLGLAAAGRAREQDVATGVFRPVQELLDPCERARLRLRQPLGCGLGGKRVARPDLAPLTPALRLLGRDEREGARRRRAVVLGDPEGELDERRRHRLDDPLDGRRHDTVRGRDADLGDDAAAAGVAEAHFDDRARLDLVRHLVGEGARDGAGGDERVDRGEATHRARVLGVKVGA